MSEIILCHSHERLYSIGHALPAMMALACSDMAYNGACRWAPIGTGMTDASTTIRPSTPLTRKLLSTTLPMEQDPAACHDVRALEAILLSSFSSLSFSDRGSRPQASGTDSPAIYSLPNFVSSMRRIICRSPSRYVYLSASVASRFSWTITIKVSGPAYAL